MTDSAERLKRGKYEQGRRLCSDEINSVCGNAGPGNKHLESGG